MNVLWLCNSAPGVVKADITGKPAGAVNWVDDVLRGVRAEGVTLRILCRHSEEKAGQLDTACSYETFLEPVVYRYEKTLEERFCRELRSFQPDAIHIWGTEYGHTLAMVNAAEREGMLSRLAVSIQGMCSVISRHYGEGIPQRAQHSYTFRDLLRRDNIAQQQNKFALRGDLEIQALKKAQHIIGRTDWDKACTTRINPQAQYHFCNETLREEFYEGRWQYDICRKHRIFASSCVYPVKGFHYLIEAFAQILKTYPDATLAVPGKSFLTADKLRQSSYQKYLAKLARAYGVADKIEFLGGLSAQQMKQAYLEANVFAMPSTIENSPNSLGEAMLLGVPCVAADVGGVSTMMTHNEDGYIYQSTAPYMLAHYIEKIFAMEDAAWELGEYARVHASVTHDPEKNLRDLLAIYEDLRK